MRFIICILLILVCTYLEAQTRFHLLYDYQPRVAIGDDFGVAIIEDSNQYIACGFLSGSSHMRFLKVDSNGISLFDKAYRYNQDRLNGGGNYSIGYYGFGDHHDSIEGAGSSHLMFVNSVGDSLKYVRFNLEYNERLKDVILLNDSNFIFAGQFTDTAGTDIKPYIAKIDTSGATIWFNSLDDPTIDQIVRNVEPTLDGGYIIGGREEESAAGWMDLFVIKTDSAGNQQWKRNYGRANLSQFVGQVIMLDDGGYALIGTEADNQPTPTSDRWIVRLDSAGNVLWDKKYGTPQYDEGFQVGRLMPDGGFILGASSFHTFNNQAIPDINLSRLDSLGNLMWSRDYTFYGQHSHDYVNDLQITSDGGFILTGFIINNLLPQRNDLFILKTDSQGLITSLNTGFREVTLADRIYPNPTSGLITISELENLERIQLYNLKGQLMQEHRPNTVGNSEIEIEGEAGIYMLRLMMDDGSATSMKVLKE